MPRLLSFRLPPGTIPFVRSANPQGRSAGPSRPSSEPTPRTRYPLKEIHRMRRTLIRCLFVLLVASCSAQVQGKAASHSNKVRESCVRVRDNSFHSAALDREMKYRILLPCGYGATGGRFPVLYLLHGLYGDYL